MNYDLVFLPTENTRTWTSVNALREHLGDGSVVLDDKEPLTLFWRQHIVGAGSLDLTIRK